ncbi:hypothetical protein KR018_011231 [Drosophila ironensis]|nr:hypothetical protein KR018_011231 [Drosophila ironensis]
MRLTTFGALLFVCQLEYLYANLVTRHTNIKCVIDDVSYAEFKTCRLKVLGRGLIGASVYIKLLKLPVETLSINLSSYKKLNGYHPFLFNVTVDVCHFLKHPNRFNVFYYFFNALEPFMNLNSSCPVKVSILNNDFELKNFVLSDKMFSVVPVPVGSYMFLIKLITENVPRGTIYSYLDIAVDTQK